jgi:hypothetical protein
MRTSRRGDRASEREPDRGGGVATIEAPEGTGSKPSRRHYDPAWDDWNAPRRWPGILLSCLIVLGFLAIVIWHFRPHTAPIRPVTVTIPSKGTLQKPFLVGGGTKDVIATFNGTRDRSNLGFTSKGSLLILHAKCTCQYNFDVTIDQGLDQPVQIPLSGVGNHDTVIDVTLPQGNYQFSVVGSGPWRLQLIQPEANLPVVATPFVPATTKGGCGCHEFSWFSGGDAVIGPFSSADHYLKLTFLSAGNSDIFTRILNAQGASLATPLFGKSPYAHAVTIHSLPSPYFLEINATGFWLVEVRPSAKD